MATAAAVFVEHPSCEECSQSVFCNTTCFRCNRSFHRDCLRNHKCTKRFEANFGWMNFSRRPEVIYLPVNNEHLFQEIRMLRQLLREKVKLIEEKDSQNALLEDHVILLSLKIKMLQENVQMEPLTDALMISNAFRNPYRPASSATSYSSGEDAMVLDILSSQMEENAAGMLENNANAVAEIAFDVGHSASAIYRTRNHPNSMIIGPTKHYMQSSEVELSWWYLGNVALETSPLSIEVFLKEKMNGVKARVEKLSIRCKTHSSFKVGVPRFYDSAMQALTFWPSGIRFQRYNFHIERRRRGQFSNRF